MEPLSKSLFDIYGKVNLDSEPWKFFHSLLMNILEHGDAYLVYRYNMLSVYGIMEKQCSDCKYEFLTNESYEHHHQKSRCQIYKSKFSST